jgi:hypothetical protein
VHNSRNPTLLLDKALRSDGEPFRPFDFAVAVRWGEAVTSRRSGPYRHYLPHVDNLQTTTRERSRFAA